MQISSVNNYQYSKPQFKSAIPVYHWVAEANGSYAPLSDVVENKDYPQEFTFNALGVLKTNKLKGLKL